MAGAYITCIAIGAIIGEIAFINDRYIPSAFLQKISGA
jgi:hypothetical protein